MRQHYRMKVDTLRGLSAAVLVAVMLVTGGANFTAPAAPEPSDDAHSAAYPLIFPVGGDHSYVDTFGAPRSGGRTHQGTDIFADKLTPVLAVADGTIVRVALGTRAGRYIVVQHTDGWRSYYLHLNNDSARTDDGLGGAPVEGIQQGAMVTAGQVLDFVGDSGNAEETPSHLHFELHGPDGNAVNPYSHLRAAEGAEIAAGTVEVGTAGWVSEYEETNTTMVGHLDPGGGFAASVVVHGHTAYLGTWGLPGYCPNTGIRVIDVADPANPTLVGGLADETEFPGTRAETLWIGPVQTPSFEGNLAVVPVRLCENSDRDRRRDVFRGLAFYNMADPLNPALLSTWHSGDRTQGANDVSIAQRADGVLLAATTVRQSLLHTEGDLGDVRLLDISNPFRPVEVTDWDNRRDGRPVVGDHDEEEFHARHVTLTSDGILAWVSHWDAGTVLLDLEDLSTPRFVSAIGFAAQGEGNRHSSVFIEEAGLLVSNEEDLFPFDGASHLGGWGKQHIYDVGDPTAPVEIAAFATERAVEDDMAELALDGFYSVHDTVMSGSVAISSWYSDGVRIVDLSDPAQPTEIGSFVPPRSRDPVGYWVAPSGAYAFPMVWGVDVNDDLVYVSDMNSGLWIISFAATHSTSEGISPAPG